MDGANVDLKAFSEGFYHRFCGGHLQPVLDTLRYIHHQTKVWLELTTLLIPGKTRDQKSARCVTGSAVNWVPMPLHLPPFILITGCWIGQRYRLRPCSVPGSWLRSRGYITSIPVMCRIARGESSWCPACGALLIGRDRYRLTDWQLLGWWLRRLWPPSAGAV